MDMTSIDAVKIDSIFFNSIYRIYIEYLEYMSNTDTHTEREYYYFDNKIEFFILGSGVDIEFFIHYFRLLLEFQRKSSNVFLV